MFLLFLLSLEKNLTYFLHPCLNKQECLSIDSPCSRRSWYQVNSHKSLFICPYSQSVASWGRWSPCRSILVDCSLGGLLIWKIQTRHIFEGRNNELDEKKYIGWGYYLMYIIFYDIESICCSESMLTYIWILNVASKCSHPIFRHDLLISLSGTTREHFYWNREFQNTFFFLKSKSSALNIHTSNIRKVHPYRSKVPTVPVIVLSFSWTMCNSDHRDSDLSQNLAMYSTFIRYFSHN